jgi:hypothetical protein
VEEEKVVSFLLLCKSCFAQIRVFFVGKAIQALHERLLQVVSFVPAFVTHRLLPHVHVLREEVVHDLGIVVMVFVFVARVVHEVIGTLSLILT